MRATTSSGAPSYCSRSCCSLFSHITRTDPQPERHDMWNPILNRKIGAFELLAAAVPLELLLSSGGRALFMALLCTAFYFAKREFKGEFSLRDLSGLFNGESHTKTGE